LSSRQAGNHSTCRLDKKPSNATAVIECHCHRHH
jgi:hypothetical protein